jgi:hypothetical protein
MNTPHFRFGPLLCRFTFTPKVKPLGNSGFGLIQVLVISAVLMGIMMASLNMNNAQRNELRALYQKTELGELQNQLRNSFSNKNVCTWNLTNPLVNKVIDLTGVTGLVPSPTAVNLTNLFMGTNNASAAVATAGLPLPLSTTGLVVSQITFGNIRDAGNGTYVGVLEVKMDNASMIRPLKPVQISQTFSVATVAGQQVISSCRTGCEGGTFDTGNSCVAMSKESAGAAVGNFRDLDAFRRGAIEACWNRGRRLATIDELVALCTVQPGGPTGVGGGYILNSGKSTGVGCNVTVDDTTSPYTWALCAYTKRQTTF